MTRIAAIIPGARKAARGFTLIDVLTTVVIIIIVTAVAAPALAPDDRSRLYGGAQLLASDLEYAQSLSIATPDDLALVRFDPDGAGYWIAHESAPDTPITVGYSNTPYRVRFGQGTAALLFDVATASQGVTASTMTFDEYGRLTTGADASIILTNPGGSYTVRVSGASGGVSLQ